MVRENKAPGSERPMVPYPFELVKIQRETADVTTLELCPIGETLPLQFQAGQFNMLYVFGVGEVAISLSGDPQDNETIAHTIRSIGTVTKRLCALEKGDTVGVRGPFGRGWPLEETRGQDLLLLAGGIGLAPLRPALYHVRANRAAYGQVTLLYGAREPADILFESELREWADQADCRLEMTVDNAAGPWGGKIGVVPSLLDAQSIDVRRTAVMMCGPEVMLRFAIMALAERGFKLEDIYVAMERNMKCAVGFCGHCQFGSAFICKDGPVFRIDRLLPFWGIREV